MNNQGTQEVKLNNVINKKEENKMINNEMIKEKQKQLISEFKTAIKSDLRYNNFGLYFRNDTMIRYFTLNEFIIYALIKAKPVDKLIHSSKDKEFEKSLRIFKEFDRNNKSFLNYFKKMKDIFPSLTIEELESLIKSNLDYLLSIKK